MKLLIASVMILLVISCSEKSTPLARLPTYPAIGDFTILFEFNASRSSDVKC